MSTSDIFLSVVIPYVAITIFILGHVSRYRHDQFGWTTRSTQLLERRMLKWGSPLFHYGALAAIGGHVLGILIPQSATSAIGIDERVPPGLGDRRHSGRRRRCAGSADPHLPPRERPPRRGHDLIRRSRGVRAPAVCHRVRDARHALAQRVRLWRRLQLPPHRGDLVPRRVRPPGPRPADGRCAARLQIHTLSAWAILALWPFSRLVHAWSIPVQYIGRPYILYRRRYSRPGLRTRIPEPTPAASGERTSVGN